MRGALLHPFRLLRRAYLCVRLFALEYDADFLQAQMAAAPLRLAHLRAQITDTSRELEALEARS